MHGLLLIDKPAGLTSHDIVRLVRRVYQTRKVGHAGTLDPLATGVLVVAVGDGTKILQFLLANNKSYLARLMLGITTDTLDATGSVLQTRALPSECSRRLEEICQPFRGDILQIPPMFSALKVNGVPLYKLARKGEQIDRQPRPVTIDRLEIVSQNLPEVGIEVDCSKGTYIRSLIGDIGEALGCGAHMTALRRLKSGRFGLEDCITVEQLKTQPAGFGLKSIDQAIAEFPLVKVVGNAAEALGYGIPPQRNETACAGRLTEGDLVRLHNPEGLAAIGRYDATRSKEKRGDFELIRVFCQPQKAD